MMDSEHEAPRQTADTGADEYRRRFETVAENATLALFIMDAQQHCTYMNRAAEELTGFRLDELRGKALHHYVHHTRPDGSPYPLEECPIDQAFPRNMREQGEEVFVHKDGHFYPVAFTASPILEHGQPVGTIIEVRDITHERRDREERERLVNALEVERRRLADAFQNAPAFMAVVRGPEHVFEIVNPQYVELVGRDDLVGRPVAAALPEVVEQGFIEILDTVYRTGEPFVGNEVPVQLLRDHGGRFETRYVNFVYQPLRDGEGEVYGILCHGIDVTSLVETRHRVEEQAVELEVQADELRMRAVQLEEIQVELEVSNEELQQANADLEVRIREMEAARRDAVTSQAALDAFFEAAPVAAGLIDPELRYQRINAALAFIDAVRPEDAIGRTLAEVVPHLAPQVEPLYEHVLTTGEPLLNVEFTAPRPAVIGGEGQYLANYFPVRGAGGDVVGVGLVALDITDQKASERARQEQTATVETLHRIGRAVAAELDVERIVQEVTDAATTLIGAQFGAFFYNVLNEKGESYTLYSISGVPREKFSRFPMPRATAVFSPTFHGEGVVRSDDITRDPRYGHNAPYRGMPSGHLPVTSYLAVPVISNSGEVLGGLFFGHEHPAVFTADHERLVEGIAGWASVAMDNARLYEAEHRARAEAERANRVKSEFLATMSHELRTPLNATIGYAELMLAGIPEPIPEASQEQVRRIAMSGRHLLQLIEEILTFSRLEAGEERINPEPVDLLALVYEACALTEPQALTKGIGFERHLPEAPGSIFTDHRKALQILLNLMGNAVKFTHTGGVVVTLELIGDDAVFRVTDTGPGIAPEHLEKVFDPFWQVDAGSTRQTGGTGLGLSVTRRLARLMGGEVEVESELGSGSTFTVRLPREPHHVEEPGR
jgi:PAS domain S-box-containing protein